MDYREVPGFKESVIREIHAQTGKIRELGHKISQYPELGFKEYQACAWLSEALRAGGYKVQTGLGSLETSFIGEMGQGTPVIAILCEYDALPDIGHACGHNLIGAAGVGAALGLAKVQRELPGKIKVFGAPGEETGGGKTILVKEHAFDGVDAAMMFHPFSDNHYLMSTSNAMDALEFAFKGQTAHAAGSPEEGINALDGVIQLFNGINALREHLTDDVRIHGVITNGGEVANVVPDKASAQFYIRAATRQRVDEVVDKVLNIAKGAELMTGAKVSWHNYEYSNDNIVPNRTMAIAFGENLKALGVTDIKEMRESKGSSDMGNVSHVVPSIQPYISIGPGYAAHTVEFAEACNSEKGFEAAILAAKCMACTVIDLLTKPELLEKAKAEHSEVFG